MNPYQYMPVQGNMPPGMQPGPSNMQPGSMQPGGMQPGTAQVLPQMEESYIENIFRLNRGKMVTVYTTFENNKEWNAKVFRGRIEAAGRDHLILSHPSTGHRYLLPLLYLDYATFDGEIAYEYPYGG